VRRASDGSRKSHGYTAWLGPGTLDPGRWTSRCADSSIPVCFAGRGRRRVAVARWPRLDGGGRAVPPRYLLNRGESAAKGRRSLDSCGRRNRREEGEKSSAGSGRLRPTSSAGGRLRRRYFARPGIVAAGPPCPAGAVAASQSWSSRCVNCTAVPDIRSRRASYAQSRKRPMRRGNRPRFRAIQQPIA
jgi:hypothetical protein